MNFGVFCSISIIALFIGCASNKSNTPDNNRPPAAPSNMIGYALSSTSIRLNWADNSNNESCFIVFRGDMGLWDSIGTSSENNTVYIDSNLVERTPYQYYIIAVNEAGSSNSSNLVILSTRLARPLNLSATLLSPYSVRLNWIDNSQVETGYVIFKYLSDTWAQLGTLARNQSTYVSNNLLDDAEYGYYVVAIDSLENSASSDTVYILTRLAAPTNLASQCTPLGINLNWTDRSNSEINYVIYRGENDILSQYGMVARNQIAFMDSQLTYDLQYQYCVAAIDSASGIAFSDTITAAMIIAAPSNLTGTVVSPFLITLHWNDNSIAETEFKVIRKGQNDWALIGSTSQNRTAFSDSSLDGAINYLYYVVAENKFGSSIPSDTIELSIQGIYFVGSYDTPGTAKGLFVYGDYCYVADGYFGFQVIEIADPRYPTFTGSYNTPGNAQGVIVEDNVAYIADGNFGLLIYDVSNPSLPVQLGNCDTPGYAWNILKRNNIVYIADDSSGIQIIDCTNSTAPTLIGHYNSPGLAQNICFFGNYAYIADYLSGVQIMDVSDILHPIWVGNFDSPGMATGVSTIDNTCIIADNNTIVKFVIVTDPTHPVLCAEYTVAGEARSIFAENRYAYISNQSSGITILDFSEYCNPVLSDVYDTPGSANNIIVNGNYVYVADGNSGLQILYFPH
jgi:fibronectin type 3 domain-containing protein